MSEIQTNTTTVVETRDPDTGRLLNAGTVDGQGRLHGRYVAYDGEGRPELVMRFRAGVAEGVAQVYAHGRLEAEMTYAGGVQHGPMHLYDPAERLIGVIAFARGLRHGPMQTFGPSGERLVTALYADGRLNGTTVEYGPTGQPLRRATYRDDLLDGEQILFHPSGNPMERQVFARGVPIGAPERFPDIDITVPEPAKRLLGIGPAKR